MPLTLVTRVNTFDPLTFDRLFRIWFPFNNFSYPEENHLKFIYKANDHKRQAKFDFEFTFLF